MHSHNTLKNSDNQIKLAKNEIANSVIDLVMSLNLVATFSMFTHPVLMQFLEAIGQYFLFPLDMFFTLLQTVLSWRKVYLSEQREKSKNLVSAIVDTCNTTVITIVFICSFAAAAVFAGQLSTYIFIGSIVGKTLFDAGASLYYLGKSIATRNEDDKKIYREYALESGIKAAAGVVATGVVVGVMLFGFFAAVVIGLIFSAAIVGGAIYALHKANKEYKELEKSFKSAGPPPNLQDPLLMYRNLDVKANQQAKAGTESRADQAPASPPCKSPLFPRKGESANDPVVTHDDCSLPMNNGMTIKGN